MNDFSISNANLQFAGYTPEYMQYLKDKEEGNLSKYTEYVPYPFVRQYPIPDLENRAFPTTFDPRSTYMTPVKNQGNNGVNVCGIFGAIANLESLVSKTTGIKSIYSEEHARFYVSNQNLPFWFDRGPDDGVNFESAADNFTNWTGPVYQSDAPYNPYPGGSWNNNHMRAGVRSHVTGTKFLNNDISSIKQAITDYGSIFVFILWHNNDFNVSTSAYKSSATAYSVFHGLILCGWDDNFSRLNFNSSNRPINNGAWLVKDSKGTGFGQSGYFWLSYEDIYVYDHNTFTGFRTATSEKMLAFDTNNVGLPLYTTVTTYMCNMFDLTEEYSLSPVISDVMIYTGSIGSTYSIYIVPASSGSPPSVSSLTSPVATGTHTFTGFHTVTLPTPYVITGPGKYAIIVKTTVGNNSNSTHFIEYFDREYNGFNEYFKRLGESFIYYGSGWVDNYNLVVLDSLNNPLKLGNWCIRPIFQPATVTTFTPIVKGGTTAGTISLGLARGLCVILGKLKFIHVHVVINAISGSPTGNLQITGSPFTPIYETPLDLGVTSYTGVDLNQRYLTAQILPSGVIEILSCGYGPEQALPVSILAQYATIQLAGCFIATS